MNPYFFILTKHQNLKKSPAANFKECLDFNSFLACGDFCCLLTYAVWTQSVGPDVVPESLTLILSQKDFLKKLMFNKVNRRQQKHENYPACIVLKQGSYRQDCVKIQGLLKYFLTVFKD